MECLHLHKHFRRGPLKTGPLPRRGTPKSKRRSRLLFVVASWVFDVPVNEKLKRVLALLDTFEVELCRCTAENEVRELILRIRASLSVVQGHVSERRHLARSMCRISVALRNYGWHNVALAMLTEPDIVSLSDTYLRTEVVQCHIAEGRLDVAENALTDARTTGALGECTYTILIGAYGKLGDPASAQRIFDWAVQDGVASAFCVSGLIAAYSQASQPQRAWEVFTKYPIAGRGADRIYSALIRAFGEDGHLHRAQQVFEAARSTGAVSASVYTSIVVAYGKSGKLATAARYFKEASAYGLLDGTAFAAMINIYSRHTSFPAAIRTYHRAHDAGCADHKVRAAIEKCYVRAKMSGRPVRNTSQQIA